MPCEKGLWVGRLQGVELDEGYGQRKCKSAHCNRLKVLQVSDFEIRFNAKLEIRFNAKLTTMLFQRKGANKATSTDAVGCTGGLCYNPFGLIKRKIPHQPERDWLEIDASKGVDENKDGDANHGDTGANDTGFDNDYDDMDYDDFAYKDDADAKVGHDGADERDDGETDCEYESSEDGDVSDGVFWWDGI